jgi:hypothetical protein
MPVKIWEAGKNGLSSKIVTDWDTIWTSEEYREDAEDLDQHLDGVLDGALKRIRNSRNTEVPPLFLRAWAVGRALMESGVFDSPALRNERRQILWKALARKCRTGARSTREEDRGWLSLRPSNAREPRREGGRLDYFEMCWWLAEQDLQDATDTFGGSIRNVWQMLERPALRPISLRWVLKRWLGSQPQSIRQKLYEPAVYAEMMKGLRRRWPDRGPGSAKRPVHYEDEALLTELEKLLTPFASRFSHISGNTKLERRVKIDKEKKTL